MGGIKGFFLVIVSILLFFSIISLSLFSVLSSSLTYENVYKESSVFVGEILQDLNVNQIIEQQYPLMLLYCENNTQFVFSDSNYVFEIPCESVFQGKEAIFNEGIKSIVKDFYYKDYSENFISYLDNPQDAPLFLISEKAYNFTNKLFYSSLAISIILTLLLFFLTEKKSNTFLLPGIFFVFSSLLFFKMDSILAKFSEGIVFQFFGIFFSTTFSISIRLLIIGILLIAIAIVFKVFKVGFWISSFIEKFKKSPQKSQEKSNVTQIKKK